ncbi:hypothetical protein M501DRAFT_999347 [Patellaria atrata CBS 101060]|uniref:WW domain-containing protein n=1 Tax=Patellaria atrata CBS 101060 TaxID=1346257 RepID=A0A9P4S349_9PEZI|nr:hypothetical protein M501DRAFT_999347 [Patellaria atrata CBS 101060]
MATGPHHEIGILVNGVWKQWSTSAGQDYYENLTTRKTQFEIPAGWEDADSETWQVDTSKGWEQWRNVRTGRIRRTNPNPPAPHTYLDRENIQTHLRLVERTPESQEYLYRRVMMAILRYFFKEDEGFDVFQEESRGETSQGESRPDMTVLKITARPGGSTYAYDYCLIESKKAGESWDATQDHLSRHYGGTENPSREVYGIVQIGLCIRFFTARNGVLTAQSGYLHVRDDVNDITAGMENMKRRPPLFQ